MALALFSGGYAGAVLMSRKSFAYRSVADSSRRDFGTRLLAQARPIELVTVAS
jgi:hypothetical protein